MIKRFFRLPMALVLSLILLMFINNFLGLIWFLPIVHHFWISLFFIIAALNIVLSSGYLFKKADTTLDPRSPEKTAQLVTSGAYQFTRNPMYLGFLLVLFAAAIYSCNLVNFVLAPLFVVLANRWYISPEEEALLKIFGNEYADYCKKVRRWI